LRLPSKRSERKEAGPKNEEYKKGGVAKKSEEYKEGGAISMFKNLRLRLRMTALEF